MTRITPIEDFVFIKIDDAPKRTAGGIALPDSVGGESYVFGIVVACGPGRVEQFANGQRRQTPQVKVDDRVLCPRYATTVEIDGTKLYVMHETEIFAILS